ncbi:MAG: amidohydrolase family protein [Pseudobdellovibrionaceae bacterium]
MNQKCKFNIPAFTFLFLFTAFLLHSTNASADSSKQAIKSIYDMHIHFACTEEKNDCYINPAFRKSWKFSVYMQAFGIAKNELNADVDELIIERLKQKLNLSDRITKGVILGIDGVYDRNTGDLEKSKTQVKFSNHFLYEQIKGNPSLLFGPSINPFSKNALQELEWAKQKGAVLIKWIPCIMGFSPDENDPRLTAFYKKLIDLKLPLLSHTGNEGTFLHSDDEYCSPEALRVPLKLGVTVIAAHLSSKGQFRPNSNSNSKNPNQTDTSSEQKQNGITLIYKLMNEFPNLYVDISSVTQINRYDHIELAKPLLKTHRVLYGSDWPLISAQLMGLPLVSWRYYGFQLDSETIKQIKASPTDFDKDVLLKKGLGIPDSVFSDTAQFFNK